MTSGYGASRRSGQDRSQSCAALSRAAAAAVGIAARVPSRCAGRPRRRVVPQACQHLLPDAHRRRSREARALGRARARQPGGRVVPGRDRHAARAQPGHQAPRPHAGRLPRRLDPAQHRGRSPQRALRAQLVDEGHDGPEGHASVRLGAHEHDHLVSARRARREALRLAPGVHRVTAGTRGAVGRGVSRLLHERHQLGQLVRHETHRRQQRPPRGQLVGTERIVEARDAPDDRADCANSWATITSS